MAVTPGRPRPPAGTRARGVLAAIVFAWLLAGRARAEDELPPERQVPILTRALAYDENLRNRAGDELVVAILAKAGSKSSEQAADAIGRAFSGLAGIKVQGLPLKSTRLGYTSAANLITAIGKEGIDVLYVAPGLEAELAAVLEVTKKLHVLSLGGREDHVTKGASLGVFLVSGKPTICVNLAASKAEGAAFGSDLLRLAKVIR
jgi:hypothetical protein